MPDGPTVNPDARPPRRAIGGCLSVGERPLPPEVEARLRGQLRRSTWELSVAVGVIALVFGSNILANVMGVEVTGTALNFVGGLSCLLVFCSMTVMAGAAKRDSWARQDLKRGVVERFELCEDARQEFHAQQVIGRIPKDHRLAETIEVYPRTGLIARIDGVVMSKTLRAEVELLAVPPPSPGSGLTK